MRVRIRLSVPIEEDGWPVDNVFDYLEDNLQWPIERTGYEYKEVEGDEAELSLTISADDSDVESLCQCLAHLFAKTLRFPKSGERPMFSVKCSVVSLVPDAKGPPARKKRILKKPKSENARAVRSKTETGSRLEVALAKSDFGEHSLPGAPKRPRTRASIARAADSEAQTVGSAASSPSSSFKSLFKRSVKEGPKVEIKAEASEFETILTALKSARPDVVCRHVLEICEFPEVARALECGQGFSGANFRIPGVDDFEWLITIYPTGESKVVADHVTVVLQGIGPHRLVGVNFRFLLVDNEGTELFSSYEDQVADFEGTWTWNEDLFCSTKFAVAKSLEAGCSGNLFLVIEVLAVSDVQSESTFAPASTRRASQSAACDDVIGSRVSLVTHELPPGKRPASVQLPIESEFEVPLSDSLRPGKYIESPDWLTNDSLRDLVAFYLEIYPNGKDAETRGRVYVRLCRAYVDRTPVTLSVQARVTVVGKDAIEGVWIDPHTEKASCLYDLGSLEDLHGLVRMRVIIRVLRYSLATEPIRK